MIRLFIDMNVMTDCNNVVHKSVQAIFCDECVYKHACFNNYFKNGKPCASRKSKLYLW